MAKKTKEQYKKEGHKLAFGAGLGRGFAHRGLTKLDTIKVGSKVARVPRLTKAGAAVSIASSAAGLAASYKNFKGSDGLVDFVGGELANAFLAGAGGAVGFTGAGAISKGLKKARPLAKKYSVKKGSKKGSVSIVKKGSAEAKAAASAKNVKVVFRRIGGRIVPIRKAANGK